MELSALEIFVDVMRVGSFAAVARSRGVAASSISRTVAALEEELGGRLFQRSSRRVEPTEAARELLSRIEPLVGELADACRTVTEGNAAPRGRVRMTAPVTFGQLELVPLLGALLERHPELELELLLTDRLLDLVADRIDLAVRLGVLEGGDGRPSPGELSVRRLCDMRYVLCASPGYLARRPAPRTPEELAGHECLRFPVPGFGARWRFRVPGGSPTEVEVHGRLTVSNGAALRSCAVAGLGVVLLPSWNVAADLRSGALVRLLPELEATASEYRLGAWLLQPSRSYVPGKVRAVAEFFLQRFAEGAPGGS